jgi:hypothetical protein
VNDSAILICYFNDLRVTQVTGVVRLTAGRWIERGAVGFDEGPIPTPFDRYDGGGKL